MVTSGQELRHPRQAVVVIHGIGEQRPGALAQDFVDSLIPKARLDDGRPNRVSSPDALLAEHELQRFRLWPDPARNLPETDILEYYWAHKVDGTTTLQTGGWIGRLMWAGWRNRLGLNWQRHTRIRWAGSQLATFAALFGALVLFVFDNPSNRAVFIASVIVLTVVLGLLYLMRGTAGDAARYLGDRPHNVALRNSIRIDGVALLRKLHESQRYDRIVIVGHSLGSVIGYDLIKNYWVEVHKDQLDGVFSEHEALAEFEDYLSAAAAALDPPTSRSEKWQQLQWDLFRERRRMGSPWLISDFVTIGSPLAHAAALLARDTDELDRRQEYRSLPTCPPQSELEIADNAEPATELAATTEPKSKMRLKVHYDEKRRYLHAAAPFAMTRWTNLYFHGPAGGFFGDPVGGPMSQTFGDGVEDVPLPVSFKNLLLWSHNRYWRDAEAAKKLDAVLDLRCNESLIELNNNLPHEFKVPRRIR